MSLKFKIVLSFMLCILFAFSPLFYLMNTRVKEINMAESEKQTIAIIESKATEISSWLNQRISEIRIIHQHPDCRDVNIANLKPYITKLNNILQSNYGNLAETFAVGGLDGLGWVSDDITINVSQRKYFKEAMKTDKEYVISDPVISKSDNLPIFLICYPIKNQSETVGFINGSVNLDKIKEIVNEIDIYNGYSWIMDKQGNIYSSKANKFMENDFSNSVMQKIKSESFNKKSGKINLDSNNKKDLSFFYSSIPLTDDWLLCTIIENDIIYAQTNMVINLILAVCVAMFLLTCVIAVLVSRTITKPIDKLKLTMEQLSYGNLEVTFDSRGKDEISILGKAFNNMVTQIKSLLNQVILIQSQKRVAELKTLQSQINPHFLYNTLDTLQWKALEKDAYEIADIVNSLSRFFRISLSNGRELITISDEIQHVKSYLEIQKMRYKEKISYDFILDKKAGEYLIPKIIIQPLVENCIYHGIKPKGKNGTIIISVKLYQNYLDISVKDDGCGMNEKTLQTIKNNLKCSIKTDNYGLYNINERLHLWFLDEVNITIDSKENVGTDIHIKLPLMEEEYQC